MKVKATVNLGRLDYPGLFPFLAGEVREVSDSDGETLLSRGHAVKVTPAVASRQNQSAKTQDKDS